jgi:pimeloyl-ACP methyl ester carboxylesterase
MKNLIFLHGALGHSNNFEPYETALSKGFNVHKILFHGHGGTPIPAEGLSIELYVSQLTKYIEDNKLSDIHIFGYSMGGYVALLYASKNQGKVASILTLAVKHDWDAEAVLRETNTLNPELLEARAPKYTAQLITQHKEHNWKQLLISIAGLMRQLAEKPLLNKAEYESLNIPVQIMVGDRDTMVTIEETLEAVRSIPRANIAVIPNAKHAIDTVKPDVLISLMKDFWKL